MNKFLLIIILFLAPVAAFSQAQLVINGTSQVTIVESGGVSATPIYIEIANPATNAISVTGTHGWIQSESEFNMVKWDIGATTGSYVVPFGYKTTEYLPLTVAIGSAGSAGGSILFSTFHAAADIPGPYPNANTPSDVTNMHSSGSTGSPSVTDNSENVVDRFWIMDTYKTGFVYATKPTVTQITFSYISSGDATWSEVSGVNTFTESTLLAQRFNTTASPKTWGDFEGTGGTVTGGGGTVATVTSGAVSPANFFRSWTLSSSTDPLPIQLSSFTAQCDNDSALIQWTSQTELNNDFYTVEKTTDGIHYVVVGKSKGAGTSSLPINYSITDNSPLGGQSYYVLYQTDFDGNRNQVGDPISFNGCGGSNVTSIKAYNTTSYIQLEINSIDNNNYNISLVNMLGQTIYSSNHSVALGNNEIRLPNNVSPGVYILNVRNSDVNYCQKMVIGVR